MKRLILIILIGLSIGLTCPSPANAQQFFRRDWISNTSSEYREIHKTNLYRFLVPENWADHPFRYGTAVTPNGAFFTVHDTCFNQKIDAAPNSAQCYSNGIDYGVIPLNENLEKTTRLFFNNFFLDNQHLTEQSPFQSSKIAGRNALVLTTAGKYPLTGEQEIYVLYTVLLTDSTVFHIATAVPKIDYSEYQPVFEKILDSIRFFGKLTTDAAILEEKVGNDTTATTPSDITTTGYVDLISLDNGSCRIRIISRETVYIGTVTYKRLSDITNTRLGGYEEANRILRGKRVSVVLSNINGKDKGKSIEFGNLGKLSIFQETNPSRESWKEKVSGTDIVIDLSTDILFDFNKSEIKPEAAPDLIRLAQVIRNSKTMKILLTGFTDSVGSEAYNLSLSSRRAISVKNWLIDKGGISSTRLATKALGETQPVAPNTLPDGSDNPAGRTKNRRVEIRIPR